MGEVVDLWEEFLVCPYCDGEDFKVLVKGDEGELEIVKVRCLECDEDIDFV